MASALPNESPVLPAPSAPLRALPAPIRSKIHPACRARQPIEGRIWVVSVLIHVALATGLAVGVVVTTYELRESAVPNVTQCEAEPSVELTDEDATPVIRPESKMVEAEDLSLPEPQVQPDATPNAESAENFDAAMLPEATAAQTEQTSFAATGQFKGKPTRGAPTESASAGLGGSAGAIQAPYRGGPSTGPAIATAPASNAPSGSSQQSGRHGATRKARPCREIRPDFPSDLLERKASVQIHLILEIDQLGRVVNVNSTHPADYEPSAVGAAIAACRDLTFDPALEDGTPVASMYRYRVDFNYSGR